MAFGWTLLFQRLISVACFRFVRLLFTTVQRVCWQLNGTARRIRESTDPQKYERSVQVVDVLLEHHFCNRLKRSLADYFYVHNRFEDPQFIIDNEHITLMTITDTSAIFVAAKDKGQSMS
jgi:hypothetical protein